MSRPGPRCSSDTHLAWHLDHSQDGAFVTQTCSLVQSIKWFCSARKLSVRRDISAWSHHGLDARLHSFRLWTCRTSSNSKTRRQIDVLWILHFCNTQELCTFSFLCVSLRQAVYTMCYVRCRDSLSTKSATVSEPLSHSRCSDGRAHVERLEGPEYFSKMFVSNFVRHFYGKLNELFTKSLRCHDVFLAKSRVPHYSSKTVKCGVCSESSVGAQ